MSEELKAFFNSIEGSEDYLLLMRLYYNPSSVLGSKQDMNEAEEEYYHLHDYFRLMMNNNLSKFICLVSYDDNFLGKDDIQVWRKLHFFVYDSIDFKKYYHSLDDPDVVLALNDEIPLQEYRRRKIGTKTKFGLFDIYEAYKKYKRLFEHNYPSEQVDNYDITQAKEAKTKLRHKLEYFRETIIKRKDNKELALKMIKQEDYSKANRVDNTYLYRHQINSPFPPHRELDDLVCENEFLDIIEEKLDEGTIEGVPLDNALNIIIMGISIKKRTNEDTEYLIERLGKDLVKSFDLQHAESLVSKITLYKINNNKQKGTIIQFCKR